jgi:hypothetical protein
LYHHSLPHISLIKCFFLTSTPQRMQTPLPKMQIGRFWQFLPKVVSLRRARGLNGNTSTVWLKSTAEGVDNPANVRGDQITSLLPRFMPGKKLKRNCVKLPF